MGRRKKDNNDNDENDNLAYDPRDGAMDASLAVRDPFVHLAVGVILQAVKESSVGVDTAQEWLDDPNGGGLFVDALGLDPEKVRRYIRGCPRFGIPPLAEMSVFTWLVEIKRHGGDYKRMPKVERPRPSRRGR